jgi:hypothetical protein
MAAPRRPRNLSIRNDRRPVREAFHPNLDEWAFIEPLKQKSPQQPEGDGENCCCN